MRKRKKSKKLASTVPPAILVTATDQAEMDAVMKGIGKKKVGFDIVDIPESVGGIPVVRVKNHPVQL
jgi:hypothetical protein